MSSHNTNGVNNKPVPKIAHGEIDYDQEWSTSFCQCGGYPTCCQDWCCALWFPNCAIAIARERVDGTHCCFNLCCVNQCTLFNVVRRRYGIQGTDLGDACYVYYCNTCAVRQALSEANTRGMCTDRGPYKWSPPSQNTQTWRNALCACNCASCCYAYWFPCCIAAQTRTKFDDSHCCFNLAFTTMCDAYNMVRQGYGIDGNCCCDFIRVYYCGPCALSQSYEEVEWHYRDKGAPHRSLCWHC